MIKSEFMIHRFFFNHQYWSHRLPRRLQIFHYQTYCFHKKWGFCTNYNKTATYYFV